MGGYHWFDGDGMVHAVTLGGDGSAAYCSRWVATARLAQEQRIGAPLAVKSELNVSSKGTEVSRVAVCVGKQPSCLPPAVGDSRGRAALLHMAVASICRTLGLLSDKVRGRL